MWLTASASSVLIVVWVGFFMSCVQNRETPLHPTRPASSPTSLSQDSGAQYIDGTTDVTRTVHFGTPTQHQRRCFTLVLKVALLLHAGREKRWLSCCVRLKHFALDVS